MAQRTSLHGDKKNKRLQHILELAGFVILGVFIRCIPLRFLHKVGAVLGTLAYRLLTSRRRVTLRNLRNAYPEASEQTLEHIARGAFCSVTTTLMEILHYPRMNSETILRRITIDNPELLTRTAESGRGCVFLTAHYGSWELAMQSAAIVYGKKGIAIAKPLSNPYLEKIIHRYRSAYAVTVLPMQGSVRECLKVLKEGGIVCLAADQAAAKESITVEFFGREVPTFAGPAAFTLKTSAVLLVGLALRLPDGTYRMHLYEVNTEDLKGDSDENILELTKRHVRLTEELIKEVPEQWMWMHKRWKHVPERI